MAKTSKGKLSRRALLAGTASAVGAKLLSAQDNGEKDPTKVQGELAREIGERSPYEEPKRTFFSSTRNASSKPARSNASAHQRAPSRSALRIGSGAPEST